MIQKSILFQREMSHGLPDLSLTHDAIVSNEDMLSSFFHIPLKEAAIQLEAGTEAGSVGGARGRRGAPISRGGAGRGAEGIAPARPRPQA